MSEDLIARDPIAVRPQSPHDGEFRSFGEWVDFATRWIGGTNALCIDAKDRVCRCGADFMRARDEGAFPVSFYHGFGPQTPAQQRKSAKLAERKMRSPW